MNRRFRMVVFGGSIAIAVVAACFWFGHAIGVSRAQKADSPHARFLSDFDACHRWQVDRSFIFADRKAGVIRKVTIEVQGIVNPEADCFFAAIYVPKSANTRAVLETLSEHLPQIAAETVQNTQFADKVLSGRIIVYQESPLNSDDRDAVRKAWARHALLPSFWDTNSVLDVAVVDPAPLPPSAARPLRLD